MSRVPAVTVIDPRIAARRNEVERGHARRRFRALVALAAALVLVLTAMGVVRSPLVALDRIAVQLPVGAQTSRTDVLFVAGLHHHQGLAEIDVAAVARRVARLPRIDTVHVRRRWPHTVDITLTERRPAAQVAGSTGSWLVVDSSGRILAARPQRSADLVTVKGPPVVGSPGMGLPQTWASALDLATSLPLAMRPQISSVGQAGADLQLEVAGGGLVRFCGRDQLAAKLVAMNTMLANVDPAARGTIDVCVPSAPVLTPAAPPPLLPPPMPPGPVAGASAPALTPPAEGA